MKILVINGPNLNMPGVRFTVRQEQGRFTPEGRDEIEFMLCADTESPILAGLKRAIGKVTYINPDNIVLDKIICGDAGDNIKSVIRYEKNGRVRRISEREWKRFADKLDINTIDDIRDLSRKETSLIQELVNQYSQIREGIDYQSVKEMLDYNKSLVWLNESIIPETIISKMNEQEYKVYDISYIKNNYKTLTKQSTEIESLFEGVNF